MGLIDKIQGLFQQASTAQPLPKSEDVLAKANFSVDPVSDFRYKEYEPTQFLDQLYSSDVRPSGISNETLRLLSFRSVLVSSIISKRVNQVRTFSKYTENNIGWRLIRKDVQKDDEDEDAILEEKEEMIKAVENLGFSDNPVKGSFKEFLGLFIQDSLIFDGAAIEVLRNNEGIPVDFKVIDGGSIHPRYNNEGELEYDEYQNGAVVRTYSKDEILYCVRNKTTDRRWLGYGVSELERLINTVTSHLFTEEYNKRLFKSGHFLSGIVSLKGQVSREQLQEFKRDFYSFVTGIENSSKVAIVNAPQGVDFTSAIRTPQEMGFTNFMDYLVKVATSVFQMDPAEINFFVNGGAQQPQSLGSYSQEFRLKYSKDSGLIPLLSFIEDVLNYNFLSKWSDRFTFEFVGLESSKTEDIEYILKSKKFKTLNEVRVEQGLPELEVGGDCIEDNGYMQVLQASKQGGGMPGDGGDGGQEPDSEERQIIEMYLDKNGFGDEDKQVVLDAFDGGSLTFDDFKNSTGISDEEIEEYRAELQGQQPEEPSDETPGLEEPVKDEDLNLEN